MGVFCYLYDTLQAYDKRNVLPYQRNIHKLYFQMRWTIDFSHKYGGMHLSRRYYLLIISFILLICFYNFGIEPVKKFILVIYACISEFRWIFWNL